MILKAETRKKILQIPMAREASNWVVNLSNRRFYKKINRQFHFDNKIKSLEGKQKGKRCFIVGNGPSLTVEQLETIKHEDCFGANRIYKMFDRTSWRPKYYVIQDKYDKTKGIYEKLEVEYLFVSDFYWREHNMLNPNAVCYHIERTLKQTSELPFSEDAAEFVQAASTVTYTMIQLAVYMGYEEIYLIGMDHTYANITNDKGEIIKQNKVKNHIFEDENPNEVVANIQYMELAYGVAKAACQERNIRIYNATVGGHLEVFDRVDFWSLFHEVGV